MSKQGEVLIAHRPEDAMLGGMWEFPGGKKEKDESIRETTVRELKEELGVDIEITDNFMELDHTYSHLKITLHAFLCKLQQGEPQANASQQVKWVSIEKLDDYPFPKANRQLTEKLQEKD